MTTSTPQTISWREAFWTWCRVAALSFGGPAGQIAVMHRILVEEKKWISEDRFLHALNYCMLLSGPEAQQLATYVGWLLHRTKGGLIAGILFILPGAVSILALSMLYAEYHDLRFIQAVFFGLKPAIIAIVFEAVLRISKRVLKNKTMVWIAVLSFVAIFFFNVPFPVIVIAAGLTGCLGAYRNPGTLSPMVAGILGSLMTTWTTFVPCFFWIFLGAPSVERLRGNPLLTAALSCITAAVVGVVLNLGIWFALHTLFTSVSVQNSGGLRLIVPDWASVALSACLLAGMAFLLTFRWRQGMVVTLAVCCTAGTVLYFLR